MPSLSATQIVRLWELGNRITPVGRSLIILMIAYPNMEQGLLEILPIGDRNRYLFEVCGSTFGDRLNGFMPCSKCRERVEFEVSISDILTVCSSHSGPSKLLIDGFEVSYRLPDSCDLASLQDYDNFEVARLALLKRCIIQAYNSDIIVQPEEFPKEVMTLVETAISEADPLAEVLFDLECLGCGNRWPAEFDITTFLWDQISAFAQRLLIEVHTIARTYGWSEEEILSMSSTKRQFYLELIG